MCRHTIFFLTFITYHYSHSLCLCVTNFSEVKCVFCEVRTEYFYIIYMNFKGPVIWELHFIKQVSELCVCVKHCKQL
jgi:hypothetical protein